MHPPCAPRLEQSLAELRQPAPVPVTPNQPEPREINLYNVADGFESSGRAGGADVPVLGPAPQETKRASVPVPPLPASSAGCCCFNLHWHLLPAAPVYLLLCAWLFLTCRSLLPCQGLVRLVQVCCPPASDRLRFRAP